MATNAAVLINASCSITDTASVVARCVAQMGAASLNNLNSGYASSHGNMGNAGGGSGCGTSSSSPVNTAAATNIEPPQTLFVAKSSSFSTTTANSSNTAAATNGNSSNSMPYKTLLRVKKVKMNKGVESVFFVVGIFRFRSFFRVQFFDDHFYYFFILNYIYF